MQKISEKSIIVWRIRFYVLFILMSFISGGIGIFNMKISIILVLLCIILAILAIIIYCPKRYLNTMYSIKNGTITIKRNVVFNNNYSISIKKIQYVQIIQTPLQRFLHLCSIVFHTAGSTIRLEQLSIEEGIKIRNITYN